MRATSSISRSSSQRLGIIAQGVQHSSCALANLEMRETERKQKKRKLKDIARNMSMRAVPRYLVFTQHWTYVIIHFGLVPSFAWINARHRVHCSLLLYDRRKPAFSTNQRIYLQFVSAVALCVELLFTRYVSKFWIEERACIESCVKPGTMGFWKKAHAASFQSSKCQNMTISLDNQL